MIHSSISLATFILVAGLSAFLSVQAIGEAGPSWNYTDQQFWTTVDTWQCGGMRQSPIDIDTSTLVMDDQLINLTLTNFDQSYSGNFTNTGHGVQFNPNTSSTEAFFVNHRGTYRFLQFHFHWGNTAAVGSEHTVNGRSYGAELHFVTRRTTGSGTAGDANAVLGVLLVSDPSMDATSGPWMTLLDNIPTMDGSNNLVTGIRLTDFLPTNLSYYYYEGSLTTPACSEVVQWFLLRNPVNVPEVFLTRLRSTVQGENGEILDMNFRMIQDLNGRQVMIQAVDDDNRGGSALGLSGKVFLALAALIIQCLLNY